MISEGQEAWEEAVAGGWGSELGVFLTDSKRDGTNRSEQASNRFIQSSVYLCKSLNNSLC